ncbi:hybrid sensor histidine kinase/response regulator [Photobacterium proteolyticum]|uniref:histidine kinase n=1 Tax=Photobacterium proteolyticum TaxID=1903952 RepID=A0A1Q9G6C4_9GAMM|nr:response regulator [Photobacterium proteolyticum]OLQ69487.1 hybrid sensor histidine kinase/response regulator [Photobacterium proteolyticum]
MAAYTKSLTLWFKYAFLISLITLLLSFCAGEVVRGYERNYLEDKVDRQLQSYFQALSSTTIEDVLTEDVPHLETILEQATAHNPDLIYVLISNEAGVLLASSGQAPGSNNPLTAQYHRTIMFEGEVFGSMTLALSKERLLADINHHVDQIRFISAASLLLLGFFCYFLTHYLLLSPLNRINRRLLSIDGLALPVKPDPEHLSELARLDKSVNVLQKVLKAQKDKERQLQLAKRHAEEANKSKTEFIATMSHEIRTPMNVILGSLDILKDESLSTTAKQFTSTAQNAAKLLLNQLNDILDYSKLDANKVAVNNAAFSPVNTVENVIALFAEQATKRGIELAFHSDPASQSRFIGDEGKITQVLTNLLGNAIKFTESGTISLAVTSKKSHDNTTLTFTVEDSGIGIDKEKIGAILDPFVQSDPSFSRRYGGAGMGLAISNKLLAMMGGQFDINSSLGKGSTFSFQLTLQPVDNTKDNSNCTPIVPTLQQQALPILLVEDSPSNQLIAKTLLAKHGFQVNTANNGLEAVQAMRSNKFALVLMDLQMPEMNGLDACSEIRKLTNAQKQVPIVAMTANVSDTDRRQCLSVGMDDFLSKPIDKNRMLQVICYWLGRSHQDPPIYQQVS